MGFIVDRFFGDGMECVNDVVGVCVCVKSIEIPAACSVLRVII